MAGRTTFPTYMSEARIERTLREAYRYGERIGGDEGASSFEGGRSSLPNARGTDPSPITTIRIFIDYNKRLV